MMILIEQDQTELDLTLVIIRPEYNSFMALPTNLSGKLKAVPMDPVALATDLQLAYTLSFAQHNISHQSIYVYPRDLTQSPLEQYQFANFDESTYEQLLQETIKNYKHKNKQIVKGMRCGFKQFYARVASTTFNTAVKYVSKQKNAGEKKLTLAKEEEEEYRIEKLKGNNPTKWPESTKEFVKDLNNLPWHAFSTDAEYMFVEFVESAKNAIINLCHRSKSVEGKLQHAFKQNLLLEIEAFLGVILRTNSQTFILQHLRFISQLHRYLQMDPQSQVQICKRISSVFEDFFKLIPKEAQQKYHYPESLWNKDPFVVMKKIHFPKYSGLCYYSIATDGDYLYIYVSAVNGGMFKVGTGNGSTKAGKVYLQKQVHFPIGTKVEEVNWVYLKGQLYLKSSLRDPWVLQVVDPNTFKKEGSVQLFCPSLFGQQSLINLNKNSPLLTDGNNLYFLGTRLKICKNQQSESQNAQNKNSKSPQKQGEDKKQIDQKKKNLKKKAGKKNQQNEVLTQDQKNQNYQKILEIVLFEFSVDSKKTYVYDGMDEYQITQLYDSFSGYFSKEECIRALVLNNYDLAETCQWLFNEGEKQKEKNIKILDAINFTILAQSQITSNFQEKAIKGASEITTKEGSILSIFNIYESIWTMDQEHVTCYSQTGAKVFSKNRRDFKKNHQTKLSNTLLKVYENKFARNPEFNIIYDPYNLVFYTYTWPQDGHYFPTTVLVSNDKKHTQIAPHSSLSSFSYKMNSLADVKKIAIWYMQTVDKNTIKTKYRFNDWLWYYGQRVIEVNNQLNQADSEKKRLSNKRTKILTKLNKINQVQKIYEKNKAEFANKNKVVKHIVKLYAFESEGTLKNYTTLSQTFKNVDKSPEEVPLYIACLQNWLNNSSSTHNTQIQRILGELGQILQRLKQSSPANRILINKFLLKQFYLFFPTIQRQIKFIVSLNESQLLEFIECQLQDERKQREEIVYEITKKQNLIQKYETNKCEFSEIFKAQSTINLHQNKNILNFANLLFSDVIQINQESIITKDKVDDNARRALNEYVQKQLLQGQAGNKFIQALFFSAFKILINNSKNHTNFYKYMSQMFVQIFSIYQKVVPKQETAQLFNLLPTFLFIVEVYHASQVSLHPNQKIINSLLSIVQSLQRPQLNQIHSLIEDYDFEGISPITQKIYETSHPVERGKNYNFAPRGFQNASYLLLDLDRRCQSDSNNDTLSVQMIHLDSPVGNNIQVNDGVFSSNLRLSGAVQTKKPYMIFGNAVTVDFNSSGHVKDTQSLVRYGFKFGLRPIFTGKLKLNDQKKQKIIRLFITYQNFQSYFNTLKFTTIAISNTIQNYLTVESENSQEKINKLLKGKIFKEGFQESAYKFDYSIFNPIDSLTAFLTKSEVESVDKLILKKNQEKYFTQHAPQLENNEKKQEELWNFDGIPGYIQKYLQQIKEFKGDFIDVFTEARELVKEKGTYAAMMKRKAVREQKTLWLQGEAILFLTILKHSGLLHLNLKFSIEYIKQNLKAFEEARDGIYNSFFPRIQYANEWRDLIQTYVGKEEPEEEKKEEIKAEPVKEEAKQAQIKTIAVKRKGPGKTVQLGSKVVEKKEEEKQASKKEKIEQKPQSKVMQKALFEKQVRQRLSNELIKGICNIKNIKYDENFQFDTVTTIIQQLIKASEKPIQPEEKAYKDPIQHLIKCCLFLLKFKSPSTKQSLTGHEQIVPVNISRSLSSDNRNVDTNKLNLFRQWLQNWKNWKGFKKEGRVQLQFPVQEIVKYINAWINLDQIYRAINKRYLKCQNRIQYYNYTQQLQKLLSQTKFVKYTLGSQVLNIHHEYVSGLESISLNKLKELQQKYADYKTNIKSIEVSYFEKLPLTLQSLQNNLKAGSAKFLQKIKLLGQTIFLLQSENPEININVLLYFMTFKYLSAQNEDLVFLCNSLIQKGLISPHSNQEIVEALAKEVGSNNINYKRWKDYFFIQRVLFLLRKLEINMRQKKNIVFQTQQKIAESIFYLLYHIEIPLISRLGLKIIRRLSISLKDGIKTPFDFEYKLYKQNQKNELQFKERFTLSRNSRNNVTLLCQKINSIFDAKHVNELAVKFGQMKEKGQSEVRYNIILNLHQEEDLYWLIKVLYYIDELEKKQGQKNIPEIKDFQQYLQLKNKKREGDKKQQQQNVANQGQKDKNPFKEHERNQRIFNNIPKYAKINPQLEKELPVAWFFNYCNIFTDPFEKMNASAINKTMKSLLNPANLQNAQKNPKNKNQNNNPNNPNNPQKKNWNTPIFTKLYKKYEQFNSKPPEQPKETDSAEIKAEFIKAKNIFNRIRKYFIQATFIMDQFSRNGYYVFREDVPRVKMNQICQLITSGSTNRLKDINIDLKNADIKNRLVVNDFAPNFNSKLQITIIKTTDFAYFDNLVSYQNALSNRSDTNNVYFNLLGKRQLSLQDAKSYMPYQEFIPLDEDVEEQDIEFGKQWIQSNFSRMKKKHQKVYLNDYPNDTFYIGQGGIESGIKDNILIPANDSSLTLQTSNYEKIMTEPKVKSSEQYESTEMPEELIQKINKIIDKGSIHITKKSDIKEYLLLTFYLKKLKKCDLQFVDRAISKEFAQKLFKFSENLKSYKELQAYQEDIQKLIIKLIDNQHQKLHLFGTYIHDDDYDFDIEEYLIPVKLQKLNSSNEVKQQSIQTHSTIKSNYLLKSQPPQIQQNKLLKYWEKNILPRILDFVKTTLKPIEIQDFWQQMRRPLRVGDHTQAKRVAYIICDNKLPGGAVLPDASHNWNSLQIEQIFVGENVLVKIPKSKSDFSTPLLGWGNNDQKLAKIVFIDLKNNSVLIRYRLQELAIFSYTWVPINCLMAVEKQVMHISTKNIYQQLNKKIEGMIYIYAKQCLTKLASSVSDVDNIKLIKQTILDLFIKNPISGCFNFPKPVWSMRPIFQKMLEDGNFAIIDSLQKHFCSIKGIDLNLNSEKMIELNRFVDAKALIVSFKRDAKLAVCSGVRFYNDKFGYNEVAHVYTAKSQKTDLEPLEFNQPNIYCKYYTNKECLPIVEQNNYKVYPIEATIFAVDEMWTIGCYLGEVACEIAAAKNTLNYLNILQRLNTIFLKWLSKKSVSCLCSHLSKLISKIALTIANICQKHNKEVTLQVLGTSIQQIKDMIGWINNILAQESNQKVALYSALLQNLSEMVASLIVRTNVSLPNLPEHIRSSVDLIKMFKEIDNFTKTKKMSLIIPSSQANYQWERILQISNIPRYFNQETVYNKIKEIVHLNKGKILCPKLDIYQKNGVCYVLVDGWDINELVQEEIMQKMEQEEIQEERQEEMNQAANLAEWQCPACTFKNPHDVNMCQMCDTPAPVPAKQQQIYDQVEATDLKAAQRKIKQREAKRFEEVKVQILRFFEDQYKVVCDLVQKRNHQSEQHAKKQGKKHKKDNEHLDDLKEIPKKPQIKLQTGSSVFQKDNIDQFLKVRFEYFPAQLKKLVEEEQTYIGKFKKLLNLGYDLWGDCITNQNATLIPFNYLYLLMDYIQTQICKGSSSVLSYSQESIRILSAIPLLDHKFEEQPVNYTSQNDMGVRVKYKALAGFKSYNIRYSWKLVKELNLAASKCLQFINMDLKFDKQRNDTCPVYNDSLGYKIKYFRNLIMGVIKLELFQKIMQKTSVLRQADQVPKVILERLKIKENKSRVGLVTVKQKEDYLFTKSHDQFSKIAHAHLRPFKPKGTDPYLSFTVTFKGQNVQGEAGPYRQFFTDLARELEPKNNLGLFIPTPNNRNQSGEHKSKWIINPKANSSYHFSLFEFIGILMGCCFRTGSHLALDLPNMFWKSITHEEITDQDLEEVDQKIINLIKILKACPSKEIFESAMDQSYGDKLTWTYKGYDDEIHQMIYNGKNTPVEFEDIGKFIQMLKIKKINETKLQVKRITQGLSQLIPLAYLHCLTGEELKLAICGRPKVDVQLLKKHTKYSGGLNEQSRRIKYFWDIMRELPESERLKIIRFCWGQERLPINSEEFERNNTRFMIKPMIANNRNQDLALPRADTCFFNIELPDYSAKAIMREKILLAVNLDSVSINADEKQQDDNPLMNQLDSYDHEDYHEGEAEW